MGVIYGLYDPKDCIVRYVGQTVHKPSYRLNNHIAEAKRGEYSNRKNNWIRSILNEGRQPEMMILEEVQDVDKLDNAEIFHIAQLRDCGFDLTNASTGGGVSSRGVVHSAETRKKMSEVQRARIAADPNAKEKFRQAWFNSPNKVDPPQFYGEDVVGAKLTYDAVVDIRKRMKGGESLKSVCEDYPDITKATIHKAACGKAWPHVKEEPYKSKIKKKLSDEQIAEIKELAKTQTQIEIAKIFDVHRASISNIVNNKRRREPSSGSE